MELAGAASVVPVEAWLKIGIGAAQIALASLLDSTVHMGQFRLPFQSVDLSKANPVVGDEPHATDGVVQFELRPYGPNYGSSGSEAFMYTGKSYDSVTGQDSYSGKG